MPVRRWDRAQVVLALRERQANGQRLNLHAVRRSQSGLARAIVTTFGSHDQALRAAGIDPAAVRKRKTWNKAAIIKALRDRKRRGLGLSSAEMINTDCPLACAMNCYFGSHDKALLAAGIDPDSARLRGRPWDQAKVVQALRDRHARGLQLNRQAIRNSDGRLEHAIAARFPSHDAALRAAGFDPIAVRKLTTWDKGSIIKELHDLRDRGLPLNAGAINQSIPSLEWAMRKHFGSHDAALRAAGIDPNATRLSSSWGPEKIIAALRDRLDRGLGLNTKAVSESHGALGFAMRQCFGSHDAALRAAGIDPASVRKAPPPMTAEEIIASLQGLARDGAVADKWVAAISTRLRSQAKARFGSLKAAADAAGLKYISRHVQPGTRAPSVEVCRPGRV